MLGDHSILIFSFIVKVNLLAARNERESVQIAIRPKVSWAGSSIAGVVQIQCSDLCSTSGDRLVPGIIFLLMQFMSCFSGLLFADISSQQVGCWPIINIATCCACIGCSRCSCTPWSSNKSNKFNAWVILISWFDIVYQNTVEKLKLPLITWNWDGFVFFSPSAGKQLRFGCP